METYSPFFQTVYDEQSPTGHLGTGTHASILRAIVFHDENLGPLTIGAPTDFAVIWDNDHDTRVIKAVESIYRAGFLGSILMIGERKGMLNAVVSEAVQDPKVFSLLEQKLSAVAQKIESDPWSSSLRMLDSPSHEIIDDLDYKASLYLKNLNMLWRLGLKVSVRDRTAKRLRSHVTGEQIYAIARCVPGDNKKAQDTRALLINSLAKHIEAEKEGKAKPPESYYTNVARKLHPQFPELSDGEMLAVLKCVPGEDQEAHKQRVKLLLNLKKQIEAEKAGKPFSITVWTGITPDITGRAAIAAVEGIEPETEDIEAETEDMKPGTAEDRLRKAAPKIRLVES